MGNEAMRAFFAEMEQHFSVLTPKEQQQARAGLDIDTEQAYVELDAALQKLPAEDLKTSKALWLRKQ